MTVSNIERLSERLSPLISKIANHSLYESITSIENLKIFMEQHVFAVWDFMCLLKELYRRIASNSAPWFPPKDAQVVRLIGGIMLEEESDVTEDGGYMSHFETYILAMQDIGADTQPIKKLLFYLQDGCDIRAALTTLPIMQSTKEFVLTTFSFFDAKLHEIAAAFTYGREALTPSMFTPLLKQLHKINEGNKKPYCTLTYYLERHITLDGGKHLQQSFKILDKFIDDEEKRFLEAEQAAIRVLNARLRFLTDIYESLMAVIK